MKEKMVDNSTVTQIAILVHDIEKSCEEFAAFLGVETPGHIVTGPIEQTKGEYLGKPSDARAKLAFIHVGGNLTIELIEPDEKPSVWRDCLNKNGEGVHHIAFVIKGMKEHIVRMEANGYPLLQKGEYEGGRYAYIDTTRTLKTLVELLEND